MKGNKIFITLALTTIFFLLFCSCNRNRTAESMDVIVVWPTDDTDPTCQQWTPIVEKAVQQLGDNVVLHPYYIKLGKQRRFQSSNGFKELVYDLSEQNHRPQLILLHGTYSELMLWDNMEDSIIRNIPVVAFGLHVDRFLDPYVEKFHVAGLNSFSRYAEIVDTFMLKENLDFAAKIFPGKKRFVGCLERMSRFVDVCHMLQLKRLFASMDTSLYVNNMDLHITHDSLKCIHDRIVFQTLSHLYPEINIQKLDSTIFPVKWAFNSHRDCMHFIQLGHDDVTRNITENADRTPYLTMTAEDFLVNDSCIGGYFSPVETQMSDAIQAAREMLSFDGDTLHILRYSKKEYQINWNAVRHALTPEEDGVESPYLHPDLFAGAKLYNVNLLDHYPEHRKELQYLIAIVIAIILGSVVWISMKAYAQHKRMVSKAKKTMHAAKMEKNVFLKILSNTDSFEWTEKDHAFDHPHFVVNEYFRKMLTDFLAISTKGNYEIQVPASIDGRERQWYHIIMLVQKTKAGLKRSGFVVNVNTIKNMEAEILDANRMLMIAKERESFLASMSHQLRTPLNAIVGFSQVVGSPDMEYDEDELAAFREVIIDNNVMLTRIINNMLTHTLMGNSNMRLDMQPVSVAEFMRQDELWEYASHTLEKYHTQLVVAADCEDVVMVCDTLSLTSVLNNLVDNASKFSPEGSTVKVDWKVLDDYVTISVHDNGMGISEENLKLVFEHFYKVDTFSPGTGLGLSLCRNWMELMGGSIDVESKLGEGSCFSVKLQRKTEQ